jgi:hypothetical protein
MKNIFSGMTVALTIWLGLAAGAANAEVLSLSEWTGSATTGYTATFGRSVDNPFFDSYNFSLPLDASGNFTANVDAYYPKSSVIVISAFYLVEASLGQIARGATGAPFSSLFNDVGGTPSSTINGPVPGNYTLYVGSNNGTWGGSSPTFYTGNLVILPVPEPTTYAMLLAGLGLIGFSARRKMNNG